MLSWLGIGKLSLSLALLSAMLFGGASNISASSQATTSKVDSSHIAEINSSFQSLSHDITKSTKIITVNETVPYETTTVYDSTLPVGTTLVRVQGINGLRILTYKVSYDKGVETSRQLISSVVSTEPIDQVIVKGTGSVNKYKCPLSANSASPYRCCPQFTTNSDAIRACRPPIDI